MEIGTGIAIAGLWICVGMGVSTSDIYGMGKRVMVGGAILMTFILVYLGRMV